MSAKAAVHQAEPSERDPGVECRVYERYPTDVDTGCQPITNRRDDFLPWSAKVRDISIAGVGLVLSRRFERGTALAIELPDPASNSTYTVFGRVVHTTAWNDDTWLVGCVFVTPLSEDTLQALLAYARGQ